MVVLVLLYLEVADISFLLYCLMSFSVVKLRVWIVLTVIQLLHIVIGIFSNFVCFLMSVAHFSSYSWVLRKF